MTAADTPVADPAESAARGVLGARLLEDGRGAFRVWAPTADSVHVVFPDDGTAEPLHRDDDGYHSGIFDGIADGMRYRFRLPDGRELPDPASRWQPDGVHDASAVVDHRFDWRASSWSGMPLSDYVIYELHVGTFTEEGTFDAAAQRIGELQDLGITAVELMPVAQFPGERNWGYDGVFPYATQNSYGGPRALKRFVDRCHEAGIAVVLDVVYNHLGPDGNYLPAYGPYFIDTYATPWGDALNFDGPDSDHVREYFIRNALQWVDEFRFDALRLDAVHAILDMSAQPFLLQLARRIRRLAERSGRDILLIAESDLGDPRMIRPEHIGGLGMHAQWLDDFHHALHALLTRESDGYYADYGSAHHLVRCYNHGFVYDGGYSGYRRRSHGAPAPDVAPPQFVVCSQNHDQIGNRMRGDRLTALLPHDALRLAATATILSPFTPLLFMGEEYAEIAPFPYFVSHSNSALVEAVRSGRREEFEAFAWAGEPPDPQSSDTFASARLQRHLRNRPEHAGMLDFYRELLRIRRELPRHERIDSDSYRATVAGGTGETVVLDAHDAVHRWLIVLNFAGTPASIELPDAGSSWQRRLNSADPRWAGTETMSDDTTKVEARHLTVPATAACVLVSVMTQR